MTTLAEGILELETYGFILLTAFQSTGEAAQGLHSDVPAKLRRPGALFMMNAIRMLDGFTIENGAAAIVAGSHRGFPEAWFERLTPRQRELLRMQKGVGHPTSSDDDEV